MRKGPALPQPLVLRDDERAAAGSDRHGCQSTTIARPCDGLTHWVSQLVAPLPSRARAPGMEWVAPVDAFEHVSQLRRGDRDYPIGRRRPDEPAALQSFGVERDAQTVMPEDLDQIAPPATEH